MAASLQDEFLQMRGIVKHYGPSPVLRNIDFCAEAGEVHALVGENGAGKSTLMKILAGAVRRDAGEITIAGEGTVIHTPHDAHQIGIHAVYQEFSLIPHLSIAENILLSQMPKLSLWQWVNWAKVYEQAQQNLAEIGFGELNVRTPVSRLSVPQQQMVEIAKAVVKKPRILILDEPSAVLSQEELKRLFALIQQLKAKGTLIIYISHRLDEVFQVADRITVLKDGEIVGTVICGDGLFADRMEETAPRVLQLIRELRPDIIVAGPAFNAGRYGLACGRVCLEVERQLKIPALTGMYPENAAVDVYGRDILIVPTGPSAMGMKDALTAMSRLALKLGRGETLGPAALEGYIPRGGRMNMKTDRPASERALNLLLARLRNEPFQTEVPLPNYEKIPPPPALADAKSARLALVSECGLVPKGNTDRLEWVRASKWLKYSISGKDDLQKGEYEVIHSGYDASFALDDPDRLLPVDALRELVRRGEIGSLLDTYYITCGNHGILSQMAKYAKEIAGDLKAQDVGAVLLVAT